MEDVVDNNGGAPKSHHRSSVDTSRPFTSVKEAVAIFGERFLVRDIYHSAPIITKTTSTTTYNSPSWKSASASPSPSPPPSMPDVATIDNVQNDGVLVESVKRLEAELEATKAELKQLKERGSETEIALASLNAELHMNMAKMAQAEAEAAKKAADGKDEAAAAGGGDHQLMMRMVGSPTLAQILNLGSEMGKNGYYSNTTKKKKKKKKPIVPLVGDFLYWTKKDSNSAAAHLDNSLYGSPNVF